MERVDTQLEAGEALLPGLGRQRRPRVVVQADLLPAASVLSFVALLGIPVGWLWAALAPPTGMLVPSGGGAPAALPEETYHAFDALALLAFLGLACGLLAGAAVWLLRRRRGPVVMVAAVLGALLAGWLASRIGAAIADAIYPVPAAPRPGSVVPQAPGPGGWYTVLPWGFGAALGYGTAAIWNGMPDLGRRLG